MVYAGKYHLLKHWQTDESKLYIADMKNKNMVSWLCVSANDVLIASIHEKLSDKLNNILQNSYLLIFRSVKVMERKMK